MSRITVLYQNTTLETQAQPGENLLEVLRRVSVPVMAPCGGKGHCRKCRVRLTVNGRTRPVLACTTKVTGDCVVEVPEMGQGRIAMGDKAPHRHHPPHEGREGLGLAVDLGTTTVVVQLMELSGRRHPVGTAGEWNVQAAYGGDVISRVQYIMDHPEGLDTLSKAIRQQVFRMAGELCAQAGVQLPDLREAAVAGNTIMQHIFAGLDPSSIAVAPYTPSTLFLQQEPVRYPECPGVAVRYAPCVAGFVGGDITAGLLACDLKQEPGVSLFLDIGTNGEMALCRDGSFFCCAVASGPAFEGAEISCGMSSNPGAISHVYYDEEELVPEVIGKTSPRGLCGSGLIDLLAILLEQEVIDETGRLLPPDEVEGPLAVFVTEDENGNGIFHLTPEIALTAGDVRKLQLAKAAVGAGIEILLDKAEVSPEQVKTLFLAGGFGENLNPESAAAVGLIPRSLMDKVFPVGNSSLSGARQILMSPRRGQDALKVQESCSYLELSGNQDFSRAFIDHMMFEEE